MSGARARGWFACAALASCACSGVPDAPAPDVIGPWVVGMNPSGNAVPTDARLELRFSEPVRREGVFVRVRGVDRPDGLVLALADREGGLLDAMDALPLADAVLSTIVAAEVSMSADRRSVTLVPGRPLAPRTAYVVVVSPGVRDDRGNTLVLGPEDPFPAPAVVRFFTGGANDGRGPVATLASPAAGRRAVDPSLASVTVAFDEAVDRGSLDVSKIGLVEPANGASRSPAAIAWAEDATALTMTFASSGPACDPLCTARRYALRLAPGVTDLAGNAAPEVDTETQWFETASCFDRSPPRVSGGTVSVVAEDVSVALELRTDEPGPSIVELVQGSATSLAAACDAPAGLDCRRVESASACPASFDPCAAPLPESSFACARRLDVGGLSPDTAYAARVVVSDATGNRQTTRAVTFRTLAPRPRPVITEVFVTPAPPLDAAAEFIELFNAGSGGVDLTGWRLARCPSNPCTTSLDLEWALAGPDGDAWLEPGSYAVAAGTRFPVTLMDVVDGTLLLSGPTSTLLSRGLRDAEADGYALLDLSGRVVSTYAAQLGAGANHRGRSFERVAPDASGVLAFVPSTRALDTVEANFASPGRGPDVP